ncbi:alpha/beta hydrolase [Vineibacter terrae]|uniref:alpha/beta fold hydrolase n=1 Tax=Vineibacter terrae TaxID=2586908 RepID=UPI002E2F2DCC|nr:alpha/beta hydrolase [Vineibacter terrae]HEX2889241.1 alpha/beta hydrolase [Vineibacter terrae]
MPHLTLPSGATVAYSETGRGTPVLLVHGSPGEGRSWGRVMRHLGDGLRIVTIDLPGYGRSTPLPHETEPAAHTRAMADAVGAVMQACGEPGFICGHSYGGNVALHAAAAHADRIRGCLLLEPVFFRALALSGDTATLQSATAYFSDYVARVRAGEPEVIRHMVDFWFGDGAYARLPPPVQQFLASAAGSNARDVAGSMAETVSREALAALTAPVVIGYGSASPAVVPAIARALAAIVPNGRIEAIDRATHGMLDSHPEQVAGLIRQLCA